MSKASGPGLRVIILACVVLGTVGIAGYAMFPSASNEGYYPEQPIPFSHKQHAGDFKMDCRYCHGLAYRSPHASVPALGICMNCHTVAGAGKPAIERMKKLYAEGKPVEWIRVHELPDHARFNHARHLAKGVSCQTCHGDVASMERITQVAPLTMGWCLNCHRGQTTPPEVVSQIYPGETKADGKQIAPFHCSTCHY